MNMYEAMQQTAAHIKANPALYSFAVITIPSAGGLGLDGMGCMLGRLAQIVGYKTHHANLVAAALLGVEVDAFFNRVAAFIHSQPNPKCPPGVFDDPIIVSAALSAYAEKYRAELEVREYPLPAIPQGVRALFEMPTFNKIFADVP